MDCWDGLLDAQANKAQESRYGNRSSRSQAVFVFCLTTASRREVHASAAGILAPLGIRLITQRVCLSWAR